MKKTIQKLVTRSFRNTSMTALSLTVVFGMSMEVNADEADAKRMLKGMSDYLAAQKTLSFEYDAAYEIVTQDGQKLALVSSGSVALERPNKLHTTRTGGFVDVETFFDGQTLTLLGKNLNSYTQIEVPGTISHLVDELRVKYNRPVPAADLLLPNSYDELMLDVVDIKDLGSGVIGGVECDYFAFRKKDVDWQIWIAQGERPYPLRYTITSKLVTGGPQYTIQTRDWNTGTDFSFKNTTQANKIELKDLKGTGGLPENFKMGVTK
ncbi:MAG: DUF2092 domain-containing protein [Methyloprofundus sp.]|nr:DUF2092 domain-containing protein [Methyloprofundus sp.]